MTRNRWMQVVVAAMFVVAFGAVVAAAESVAVKITETDADTVVSVQTDGVTEEVRLDDLADGEERLFTAGETEVVVRREGDRLQVLLDGEPVEVQRMGDHGAVWVGADGHEFDLEGVEHRMMMVTTGGSATAVAGAGANAWVSEDGESPREIEVMIERLHDELGDTDDEAIRDERVMVISGADMKERVFVTGLPDDGRIRYRCADNGSELLVDSDDAIHDSYVDPATGCVMERVAESEHRIITVVRERGGPEEIAD